jgi:hypothetical protein
MGIIQTVEKTPKSGISLFMFIRKHWYLVILFLLIIPAIVADIKIAIQTNNPLYPFLDLGNRLFLADSRIQSDVNLLENNPSELIGMAHPESGYWKHTIYYWKYFWNVIWATIGNIWFISFPFVCIIKVVKLFDSSKPVKTWVISFLIFFSYLFITNSIFLVYNITEGSKTLIIPETDKFNQYLYIFIQTLPFHGIYALGKYIVISILA